MTKPVAWSYSALTAYETCPFRYKLTKITKEIQEPQTEATLWGNRVHKALELRVAKHTPLPETMQQFEGIAASIVESAKGGILEAEQKMALTRSLQPTTWFAKDVWVRGITDVTIVKGDKAVILDHKTGKPTPESAQLKLTAAITFAHKPWVNSITNAFIWLKHGSTTSETFTRDDVPTIWQEFAPRIQRLEHSVAEDKFPKRPSGLCKNYCPCRGCEHNGNYTG